MDYEQIVHKTIHYIEENLHKPLPSEQLAQQAGYSKYHFYRIFHSIVGKSIFEYIRFRRLANASAALLATDERIIDIALRYRFESQEAFTRAFKKHYQLPPGKYRKLMTEMLKNKEDTQMEEQIKGWFLSGSDPFNYEIGLDYEVVHEGKASGYLRSKIVPGPDSFATMMQQFKADRYIGKRIKLSCFLKTDDVKKFAGMWMRVDNRTEDILQFDNMSNRPIRGTTKWSRYSIILDVPEESFLISFGVTLIGSGQLWVDHFSFEEANENEETTNLEFETEFSDEPINLMFEDGV